MDEADRYLRRLSARPLVEFAITAAERAIPVVRDQQRIRAALTLARACVDGERPPREWPAVATSVGCWADVVPMPERAGVRAAYHALIAATSAQPIVAAGRAAGCARKAVVDRDAEWAWQREALRDAVFVDSWRIRPYTRARPSVFAMPPAATCSETAGSGVLPLKPRRGRQSPPASDLRPRT